MEMKGVALLSLHHRVSSSTSLPPRSPEEEEEEENGRSLPEGLVLRGTEFVIFPPKRGEEPGPEEGGGRGEIMGEGSVPSPLA